MAAVRTAFGMTVVVLTTLVLGTVVWIASARNPRSPLIDRLLLVWARIFLTVVGVTLSVEGAERIDPSRTYVFVSNHLSNIDIPVHFLAARVPIRYLAKKELFRVPFLGGVMRAIGIIEVDRRAGAAAHAAVNEQVAAAVRLGRSLMIYPEGTRSRGGEMASFKKGAFRIAISNRMDVLPMAISGSHEAWPPGKKIIRGGPVRLRILEPISVQGLDVADIDHVRRRAEQAVADALREPAPGP